MAQRDELFRRFGPIFLEAIAIMIVEESNRIRTHLGMPLITKQMFLDEITTKLDQLLPYDWMDIP